MKTLSTALLASSLFAFSQGDLTPPGAPAPTQKSLQEIWDKIDFLEAENESLKQELAANQETTLTGLTLLLEDQGLSIPWKELDPELGGVKETDFAYNPVTGDPVLVADTNTRFRVYKYNGSSFDETLISALPEGSVSLSFVGERIIAAYLDGSTIKFAAEQTDGTFLVENVAPSNTTDAHLSIDFVGSSTVSGEIGISYLTASDDLGYAYKLGIDSVGWTTTVVDSAGDTGFHTSLVGNSIRRPGICYHDQTSQTLKFAYRSDDDGAGTWTSTTLDSIVGSGAGLDMTRSGSSYHVAYNNSVTDELRHASFTFSTSLLPVNLTTVDTSITSTKDPSVRISPNGLTTIAYAETSSSLSPLLYTERVGSVWNIETVTNARADSISLAYRADGQPTVTSENGSFDITLFQKALFTSFK